MRIAFIGLGVMGRPMAGRLLGAGHELVVHSRSYAPVADLVSRGAGAAATPSEAARRVDVVVTMLPDTAAVERVILGDGGVLDGARARTLIIDMSTTSPETARGVASRAAARGCGALDAPVSGGERSATLGDLVVMAGGGAADFERARPVFDAVASTAVHVGPAGAGQVAKACNQLIVLATIEIVAEALVLARAAKLDPERVRVALLGGFARSRVLEEHGRRMLDREFAPGGRARLHMKDVEAVREISGGRVPTPAFDAAVVTLERLIASGGGDLDHAALVTAIEAEAGVRLDDAMEVSSR